MRKLISLLTLVLIIVAVTKLNAKDDILLKIGDKEVSTTEFLRIYNKNNSNTTVDTTSIDDYLQLFINFKLKVIEAESLGMDTVKSFINELAGYRKQLTKPYLSDSSMDEKLMQEAYSNMQHDVHAKHILINASSTASPDDTLKAYNKAIEARKKVLGGVDFEIVAKEYSNDPSAQKNGGNLGYFTAFQMVYPFESAAFNTKPGEMSMPVRTRFGYHIIKIEDKRKAMGQVKVAHIMVTVPKGSTPEEAENKKRKIFELHEKVKNGEDFAETAKTYSDDKGTAQKGGELPFFGTGRMVPVFEKASFAIENIGDFSEPVQTSYGWHIIKLLEKQNIGSFDEVKAQIKSKISKDARANFSKKSVITKLKKIYNFKETGNLKDFFTVVDTSLFSGHWNATKAAGLKAPLFTFADQTVTQQDFKEVIIGYNRKSSVQSVETFLNTIYERFVGEKIIAYEESQLEKKYPEFKYLMEEYHDGILLFELTDQMVWSKAVKDTVGLDKYYDANKNNFMWSKRIKASIFKYKDDNSKALATKTIDKARKKGMSNDDILALVNAETKDNLELIESDIYAQNDNDFVDKIFKITEASTEQLSDDKIIINVEEVLAPQVKTLQESRGLVTAEYQNHLEKEWLEILKKKYSVTVDDDVFKTISNQ